MPGGKTLPRLLAKGHPLPAGLFAFSPLTDLTSSGVSHTENARSEVVLPPSRMQMMAGEYLGGGDPRDPRASPLFADFTGAPPIWLAVGSTEILRDDTLRLGPVLERQGVAHQITLEQELPHVWPLFHNLLPEARATLRELGRWIEGV